MHVLMQILRWERFEIIRSRGSLCTDITYTNLSYMRIQVRGQTSVISIDILDPIKLAFRYTGHVYSERGDLKMASSSGRA